MVLSDKYIRTHKLLVAISIFILLFSAVHMLKPGFAYNRHGGFRPFGLGYQHKTVIPIWVIAIVLAIFSYLFVLMIS